MTADKASTILMIIVTLISSAAGTQREWRRLLIPAFTLLCLLSVGLLVPAVIAHWVLVAGALLALVVGGMITWFAVEFINTWPVLPRNQVSLIVDSLHDGDQIDSIQNPITVKGHYVGPPTARVRVILQDVPGQFYLQHPPVDLHHDGQWMAVNIRPLAGVDRIHFVQLNAAGARLLDSMVKNGRWGGFGRLPLGSRLAASSRIATT